jgi:glycosyl hydrolase family 9/cellulase-like Ig domain-containing protein
LIALLIYYLNKYFQLLFFEQHNISKMISKCKIILLLIIVYLPVWLFAQEAKVLANHVGYENNGVKKAIFVADTMLQVQNFELINVITGFTVLTGKPVFSGRVNNWESQVFWAIDFSSYTASGTYQVQVTYSWKKSTISHPFIISKDVFEQFTLSNVIYYFKGQRSSGLLDKADHHLLLAGRTDDTIDAHGGWYDATGDYGKHLSHLSFSSYFNPQQISLTDWSLFKTYELLSKRKGTGFRQYNRRLLDEAMYGADYLVRVQAKDGSFYRSVGAPGPGKMAKDRIIQPENKSYRIKQNKDQSYTNNEVDTSWRSYQSSYRSGGGIAIAALAIASTYDTSGDFTNADYLKAAENAFDYLEKNNALIINDGIENIVDDYCSLSAATELYKATKKIMYKNAADKRTAKLLSRLTSWKQYTDYWRADDKDRPFFHPSDAGFPLISLMNYYPFADSLVKKNMKQVIKRSLGFEFAITHEVNNPFGYSRQLVQDTAGIRRSSFFFPHGSEASPWWQGENARLGSIATAAKMAALLFKDDQQLHDSLENFATDQLNWILGLNPFDACMLQGSGYNNPVYGFFGTFEYTNAPGGIVNGITSGLDDEDDIDFNLSYKITGKDYDWRWAEQWLPHAAWYLLAISISDNE